LVLLEVDGAGATTAQAAPSLPAEQAGQPAPLQTAHVPVPGSGNGDGRRVLATPVTRRMAREMGVDLAQLQGSGAQCRVMKADVLAHAELRHETPSAPPPPRTAAADDVRPLRGLRKSIARTMAQSHTYVVPFTFVEECDTGALTL